MQCPPVAISQTPIASPGVYNQHVDDRSYMPPHSNAESQYQEQQAQRQMNWQHQQQQQMISRGTTHVDTFPRAQAPAGISHAQQHRTAQQASVYEKEEAVLGIPPSAVVRPIIPRSPNPTHTTSSQWPAPVQSRLSTGEIGPLQHAHPTGQAAGGVQLIPGNEVHHQPQPCIGDPHNQAQSVLQQYPPQQPFNTALNTMYGQGGPAPLVPGIEGHPKPPPHGYQQVPVSPNLQSQPPYGQELPLPSQGVPYRAQHTPGPSPAQAVPLLTPVPESTPSVPQTPAPDIMPQVTNMGGNVHQQPSEFGASSGAPISQLKPPVSRRNLEQDSDNNGVLMQRLNENIIETVAEVSENERIGDTREIDTSLQSLPRDPNLQCVVCGKVFKIGQIQNFKRHVASCTGAKE